MLRLYDFMAYYRVNFTFKRKRVRPPVAARTVPAQYLHSTGGCKSGVIKGQILSAF
jgi:hypothetical protein